MLVNATVKINATEKVTNNIQDKVVIANQIANQNYHTVVHVEVTLNEVVVVTIKPVATSDYSDLKVNDNEIHVTSTTTV